MEDPVDKEKIIKDYFSPEKQEGVPLCPRCGEELFFESRFEPDVQELEIQVRCSGCGAHFRWRQSRPVGCWTALQIQYFLERHRARQVLRCPFDDCTVLSVEYGEGWLEFRCPFCNRRGKVS